MNKTTASLSKGFLSVLLVLSLVLPSIAIPLEALALEGAAGGNADGSQYGGGDSDGSDTGEADSDGDGTSDSAEGEASAAAADSVASAASVAGVDVGVAAVDTTKDANAVAGMVSVDGVTMSVDAAMAAIGAIADAQAQGLNPSANSSVPGIDVAATLSANAMGELGSVVGSMTAETGDAKSVAAAETEAAQGVAAANAAAGLAATAANMSIADMTDALANAAQSVLSALNPVSTANATPINTAAVLSVPVSPNTYTTTNVAAYNSYTADVAASKAAYAAAYAAFTAALDKNDEAAADTAYAAMDQASQSMKSIAESHFGVAAVSVSLSGTEGGVNGSGAATGGTSAAAGSTGGGKTSGISASDHDGIAAGMGSSNNSPGVGNTTGSPTGSPNSSGGGGQTAGSGGPSTGGVGPGSTGGPGPTTGGTGVGSAGNSNSSHISALPSQTAGVLDGNGSTNPTPTGNSTGPTGSPKGTSCAGGCNVFNIEKSTANTDLLGSSANNDDRFHTFKTQEEAVRALILDLTNKIDDGKNTLSKIISTYAPPSDNNNPSRHTANIANIVKSIQCDGCATFSGDQTLSKADILGQLGQALAIATARAETGTNISPTVAQRGQELAKAVPSVPTVVGADGHYQAANDSAKAAVEAVLGATTPTVAVQQDGSVAGVNGNNDSTDTEPADTLSDTGGTGVKSGTISPNSSAKDVQQFWSARNGVRAKLYNGNGKAMVDENLLKAVAMGIQAFEAQNPGYHVQIQGPDGGRRGIGALTKTFNHTPQKGTGLGAALDLRAFKTGPDGKPSGKGLTNHPGSAFRGELSVGQAAPVYQQIFNETVIAAYEMGGKALAQTFRFGGYFGKGTVDLMHIDVLAKNGAANGTTLGGFSDSRVSALDISENKGLGSWGNVAELAAQRAAERGNTPAPNAGDVSPDSTSTDSEPSSGSDTPTTEPSDDPGVGTDPNSPANPTESPDGQSGQTGGAQPGNSSGETPSQPETTDPEDTTDTTPPTSPSAPKSLLDNLLKTIKQIIDGIIGDDSGNNNATSTPTSLISNMHQPAGVAFATSGSIFATPSLLTTVYEWFSGKQTVTKTYTDLPVVIRSGEMMRPYVPVILTIDETAGTIKFDLLPVQNADMISTSEGGQDWDDEESASAGPSLIFDISGNILYSDGTYAPPLENGVAFDNGFDYTYLIERYRDGKLVGSEFDTRGLPGNFFTKLWQRLVGGTATFGLQDVETVTYVYIDPDTSVSGDEYKDYTITLQDGSDRQVALPAVAQFGLYQQQLESVGYNGDPLSLTILGVETAKRTTEHGPNVFERAVNWIDGSTDNSNADHEPYTDLDSVLANLPINSAIISRARDISVINVYLKAEFECPQPYNTSDAYAYEVVTAVGSIYGTMCGSGLSWAYADGIAHDLFERGHSADLLPTEALRDVMVFFNETIPESPAAAVEQIANVTNDVTFEVKAVATDGKVLTDWAAVESITISSGVQLYFRWNGTAYQQCLPFLNDNGNYALRARNNMTTGDTESDGYDVPETNTTYRIECGGQRNNEFGVDTREIEVIVQ